MAEQFTYEQHLWDGMKQVTDRFAEGKKTLNEMIKFLDSRGSIEGDAAKKAQALCAKPPTTNEAGSLGLGWLAFRTNTDEISKSRSNLSEVYRKNSLELAAFKKEITRQRDAHVTTVSNLNRDLDKGRASVKAAVQNYHKKTEAAENALFAHEKAQQDPQSTAKTISKMNSTATKLKKEAEAADASYQTSLSDFQSFQVKYEENMKEILKDFEAIEERRVSKLKDVMDMIVTAQQTFVDEFAAQERDLREVVAKINGHEDIQNFINLNKTGLQPSRPTEYEPYKGKHPQFKKKSIPSAVAVTRPSSESSTPPASNHHPRAPPAASASRPQAKALYEYQAADATELGFAVGDIITVTKQDDSGWWEGECNGKAGMFPGNFVELLSGGGGGGAAAVAAPTDNKKRCTAKFEFVASSADELTIRVGDVIVIDQELSGWFSGTNAQGQSGLFPANYVELQ